MAYIGPHQGNEAKLMLAGSKPVAMLTANDVLNVATLLHASKRGAVVGKISHFDPDNPDYFFCLPGHEAEMEELMGMIVSMQEKQVEVNYTLQWTDEEHRRIGQLLGYAEKDIQAFLRHLTQHNSHNAESRNPEIR